MSFTCFDCGTSFSSFGVYLSHRAYDHKDLHAKLGHDCEKLADYMPVPYDRQGKSEFHGLNILWVASLNGLSRSKFEV